MTTAELIRKHPELWIAATSHPFLDGARDGSLPEDVLARWLEQDRLFVIGLTRAWGRMLAGAPAGDLGLLGVGISAFTAELSWFEQLAKERGLRLGRRPAPEAAAYIEYLDAVAVEPYAVAITAMWAVEAAYLDAWRRALGGSAMYADVIEHWANDEFAGFVARLAGVADRELAAAPGLGPGAAEAFVHVMHHERAFWGLGGAA